MKKLIFLLIILMATSCMPREYSSLQSKDVVHFVYRPYRSNAEKHNKQARRKLKRDYKKLKRQRKKWRQQSGAAALERRYKFSTERRVFSGPGY